MLFFFDTPLKHGVLSYSQIESVPSGRTVEFFVPIDYASTWVEALYFALKLKIGNSFPWNGSPTLRVCT